MYFHRNFLLLLSFLFLPTIIDAQPSDSVSNPIKNEQCVLKTKIKDHYLLVYSNQYDMYGNAQNLFSVSRMLGRGLNEITCKTDESRTSYCFKKKNHWKSC